jgi:hypothetical protein
VDENGKQHYLDATVAYRQTCLRVFEYLRRFGEFYPAVVPEFEYLEMGLC